MMHCYHPAIWGLRGSFQMDWPGSALTWQGKQLEQTPEYEQFECMVVTSTQVLVLTNEAFLHSIYQDIILAIYKYFFSVNFIQITSKETWKQWAVDMLVLSWHVHLFLSSLQSKNNTSLSLPLGGVYAPPMQKKGSKSFSYSEISPQAKVQFRTWRAAYLTLLTA